MNHLYLRARAPCICQLLTFDFIMILNNLLYILFTFATLSENHVNSECKKNSQFDNYETNYLECGLTPRKVVAVINQYKKPVINIEEDINPFSSACVQCYLCLTIAQELNNKFHELHTEFPPRILNTEAVSNGTLRKFCKNAFQTYDLTEVKGERILQKNTKNRQHSAAGGIWSQKLKELCLEYLNNNGDLHLYKRWYDQSQACGFDISNLLCRSHGIFQLCRNLKVSLNVDKPKPKKSTSFFNLYRK